MNVRVTQLEKTPLLETWGDIDHNNCGFIETALKEAFDSGSTVVLLDLSQVTYIDSGGLSVLLSAVRSLRGRGWLGVIAPNANVGRLIEIVGLMLDPAFRIFEDKQTAARATTEQVLT